MIIGLIPLGFQSLAPLAQLAEHRTLNPQVLGSSPRGRTNRTKTYLKDSFGRTAPERSAGCFDLGAYGHFRNQRNQVALNEEDDYEAISWSNVLPDLQLEIKLKQSIRNHFLVLTYTFMEFVLYLINWAET